MAKPRGLLTDYEAPWSAPYGTPVMDAAVRSGMQRLRTAGKRSGLKPNDRLFNAALLQDVVFGAGEVGSAPLAGLLAPAMPYVKKAAEYAGSFPGTQAIGPKGSWTGNGGKRPATIGEQLTGLLQSATDKADAGAERIGYPKEYARELAASGAGLLAPAALRQGARAGRAAEGLLNKVGLTAEVAPNQANMFVPVTKLAKPKDVDGRPAIDVAEEMRAAGADPRSIWAKTGLEWHPVAKQWRHEIADNNARLKMPYDDLGKLVVAAEGHDLDLTDLLDHPELYKAVPELRDYRVRLNPRGTGGVMSPHVFDDKLSADNLQARGANMAADDPRFLNNPSKSRPSPGRDKKYRGTITINMEEPDAGGGRRFRNEGEFMRTLLHEVQHATRQGSKGFPEGGDYSLGHDQYWKNAGETEARLTPNRRFLDDDERRMFYPGADPDPLRPGRPQDNYQHDFPYDQQVLGPYVSDGYGPRRGWDQAQPEDLASSFTPDVRPPSSKTPTGSGAPVGLTPDGKYDVSLGRNELRAMLPGYDPTKGYTTTREGLIDLQERFFKYQIDYSEAARVAAARGDDAAAAHFRALYFASRDLINATADRLANGGYKKRASRKPKGLLDVGDDALGGPAESDQPYTLGANGGGLIGKVDARRVNNNRKKLDAIHPAAISSRLPGVSSPERSAAMSRHLVPGIMAMSRDPEAFAQNVGTLADIPGFGRLRGMDPMKAANMAARQMADNLISIREHMSPEYWNATKVWYPKGAGFVANDHMNRYGLMRQQVAASLANLSPSTLWDLNVEQARRMADMYVNRRGSRMTPTMIDIADKTWDRGAGTTPIARGYLEDARRLRSEGKSLDDTLRDGNYKDAALLMQLMDRDVGPKPFPTIYPWGAYGPDYPRQYSPNTVALMKNAVRTMHEPTREVISDTIAPDKHKIRAFYNDILAPEEMPDEVVVDTHQVGASTLIPYSQTSRPVEANFGNSTAGVKASKLTGSSGTFGVYADAHRRAADMYGETGWNWQSPTWSGIRDVFDKAMKKPQNVAKIEDLWRQVDAGRMSIKEARDEFWKIALEGEKRIPDPDWLRLAPP